MAKPVEKGIDQRLVGKQIIPLVIVEVGGDNGGFLAVALLHQLKESIDLFGV